MVAATLVGYGQKTGIWAEDITFNSESRRLAGFTPKDYDETTSYQLMIGLHGLGDNATNYRNALINAYKWQTAFENTIFICPDGGSDEAKDFLTPEGDELIIEEAVKYANSHYNIDNSKIILQGFSLGGRSALKYGLDHTDDFSGLLLSTPAIQGIKDAHNLLEGASFFKYENGSEIPIFITVGENDLAYVDPIKIMHDYLVKNNAKAHLSIMPSIGHTATPLRFLETVPDFLETASRAPLEAECYRSEMKPVYCTENVEPSITLVNQGKNVIEEVTFNYSINSQEKTYTWKGELSNFEHLVIKFPSENLSDGQTIFTANIISVNGEADSFKDNNSLIDTFLVASQGNSKPVFQGFEDGTTTWEIEETGNFFGWYLDPDVSKEGLQSVMTFNNILLFDSEGLRESIYSEPIDLTAFKIPSMALHMAFSYHHFDDQYFTQPFTLADTLEIAVSTDCGETYTPIFKKGGADLATVKEPTLNPIDWNRAIFVPQPNEWRRLSFDLDEFATSSHVIVRFTCISGLGGTMYIDNVQFDEALSDNRKTLNSDNISIFPNPTSATLNLDVDMQARGEVKLLDALGKTVYQQTQDFEPGQPSAIHVGQFNPGVYWLQVQAENGRFVEKVVIGE